MNTGTKLDQVAAVSRLLSGASAEDEVVVRMTPPDYIGNAYRAKRFTVYLFHRYGDTVYPLSEISASIDVEKQGHEFPPPSWPRMSRRCSAPRATPVPPMSSESCCPRALTPTYAVPA